MESACHANCLGKWSYPKDFRIQGAHTCETIWHATCRCFPIVFRSVVDAGRHISIDMQVIAEPMQLQQLPKDNSRASPEYPLRPWISETSLRCPTLSVFALPLLPKQDWGQPPKSLPLPAPSFHVRPSFPSAPSLLGPFFSGFGKFEASFWASGGFRRVFPKQKEKLRLTRDFSRITLTWGCSNDPWPYYFCKSIAIQMGGA